MFRQKFKKLWGMLAMVLSVTMLVSSIPVSAIAATTNEEGYIEVSTIEDLYNIRNDLTANYVLMNDIELSEATAEGGDWDFDGRGWNPIGSNDIYGDGAFSGVFDGNGHTIKGMKIDVTSVPSGTGTTVYAGLFANITGSVKNLTLENVDIYISTSEQVYAGAIAGNASGGSITGCSVDGVIYGRGGSGSSSTKDKIYVGGIVGYNLSTIAQSRVNVEVSARDYDTYTYVYAGGITAYNTGTIKDCYNTADITAPCYYSNSRSYTGGISAYSTSGKISNCYNIGTVSATSATYAYAVTDATVTNCYYLQGVGTGCTGATSLTEAQMLLNSLYSGFDFENVWIINTNAVYPYPQLIDNPQDLREFQDAKISSLPNKMIYEKWEELDLTGCVLEFNYINADTEYITVTNDMVTGFNSSIPGEQVLTITYENQTFEFTVVVNEKEFREIYTIMDLYNIRYDLDENYILMSDIDLSEATAEGGDWDFDGRGWNPIGSNDIYGDAAFSGVFDGNGYTIKGMKIDVTSVPSGTGTTVYAGLFANVTGSVKNLTLENVDIYISTSEQVYVGAIAGNASGESITGCSVDGVIYGRGGSGSSSTKDKIYVGGIVGYNLSTIAQSRVNVEVSARDYDTYTYVYAGGITAYNTGTIKDCYNIADITASCYSHSRAYTGGISGYSSSGEISNCYNIGTISATSATYAYAVTNATVTNCYYLQGAGTGCTGATALTGSQMIVETMYRGFDFENVWSLDSNANYQYPQLISNPQDLRVMTEAKLFSLPEKVIYNRGEDLDVTGLQLVFEYENADTEYVAVTNDMILGFDSNTVGIQTLSVSYHDITFTFDVTVNEKPFIEIYTIEDLYNIRNDLTANYILMNDIDLTESTAEGGDWDFDGRGWNPIGSNDVYSNSAYSGIFDGNGYTIRGMRIDVASVPSGTQNIYIGLFANVIGEVRNLNLKDVDIDIQISSQYYIYAGALSGYTSRGKISKCNVDGEIYVYNRISYADTYSYNYVGGIVGYNNSTINLSYTQGTITGATSTNSVTAAIYAGGIAGYGGTIENCYNTAEVKATGYRSYSGGITYYGVVTNCYNIGAISGSAIINSGTCSNCYYLADTGSGVTGATSLTEAQLKLEAMYEGFDFENVWTLNSYANYPYAQLKDNVQDLNETVDIIRIIAYPSQLDYLTGDKINPTGGMVEAVYISGKTELLEITADMISGYDSTLIGEQTLTVTYGGQSDTFPINVERRPEVTGVELVSEPTIKEFVIGTAFDFTGAKVKVSYDNGTSEEIDVTEDMTTGGNINHIATQTITVVCGEYSTTFTVEVVPASISSIAITKLPSKLVYMEGEDLDTTDMELMATYSNGTTVQIKSGYTVTGFSSEPGTYEVKVEFAGQTATFEVTVNERVLSNIEIKATPDKLDYVVGEELDLTGLVVVAVYENGDLDIIKDYTVSGFDGTAGSKVITLTYKGKTASFIVNTVIKCVTKLEIKQQPVKLTYIENEALNVEGMVVQATYNDGEVVTVTDYELNGFSSLPGVHTVYVSYEGQVDSFDINVTAKVLVDLRVTVPTKTSYSLGEEFDAAGLTVVACYNNGQEYSVDDYATTGFDTDSVGAKEIQISYGGITRSFVITVTKKTPIETNGAITVGSLEARLGETISVPVTVTKNTGLAGFCHTITFDATDLAFKDITLNGGFANGTVVLNDEKVSSGEITIVWFNATDVIESGVVYYLNFEVLETAADGQSDITIAFDSNDTGNASGEDVLFTATNGGVEILSYWLGDLDGDRLCKMVDLLQLAQYVSGKEMTLTEKQMLSADVNEDGAIDIHDVVLLQQWLLEAEI